jgi:hypothetical protein
MAVSSPAVTAESSAIEALLRRIRSDAFIALVLGVAAAAVYALVGDQQRNTSSFPALAQAFLHGRAWLPDPRPWEELAIRADGGFWVPFPPFPAIVLMPVVAVIGTDFDLALATAAIGGLCVAWAYGLGRDVGATKRNAIWLAVALAVGSELLWAAGQGSHHLFAQTIALALVLRALRVAWNGDAPWLAGLLLAAAVASRLPAVFAVPVVAVLYAGPVAAWRANWRPIASRLVRLALPLLVVGLAVAWYNAMRFGSPFDFGYGLIVSGKDQQTGCIPATCTYPTSEPWFADGIESISYIPRGLGHMLFDFFRVVPDFPYLLPSWTGLSIVLSMPLLGLIVRAPWRRLPIAAAGIGIAAGILLDLGHGTWGFAQVGWRFILDVMPLAWLLLALVATERGLGRFAKGLIVWGVAVNVYMCGLAWLGMVGW